MPRDDHAASERRALFETSRHHSIDYPRPITLTVATSVN